MKISGIMPARGRSALAALAVDCWRKQSVLGVELELVIVDDQDCPAFPGGAPGGPVVYYRCPKRLTIGTKRNLACERAHGEFIAHFDSDDWSAPGRLQDQLQRLLAAKAQVTGYHSLLFTNGISWWRYQNVGWFAGTSLFYRRSWWQSHQFLDQPRVRTDDEDGPFVDWAKRFSRAFIGAPAGDLMVARIHRDNTGPKCFSGPEWKRIEEAAEIGRLSALMTS